jgi:hypothetical protein
MSGKFEDDEQLGAHELPPVIEEFAVNRRIVRWVSEPDAFGRSGEPKYAPEDLQDFRRLCDVHSEYRRALLL